MIAYAGNRRLAAGEHDDLKIRATARWPLDTLQMPAAP
jgi:N6-L-threonylcarbamoyladenine synthase